MVMSDTSRFLVAGSCRSPSGDVCGVPAGVYAVAWERLASSALPTSFAVRLSPPASLPERGGTREEAKRERVT